MKSNNRSWLVDAFNLMHQLPGYKSKLDRQHIAAMQEICQLFSGVCDHYKRRAHLVFDGIDQHLTGSYTRVAYSYGNDRKADHVIIEMMKKPDAAAKWIVITDDREIRQQAFYHSVEIIRCGDFIESYLEPDKETPATASLPPSGTPTIPDDPGKAADPDISDEEYETLMRLFKSGK